MNPANSSRAGFPLLSDKQQRFNGRDQIDLVSRICRYNPHHRDSTTVFLGSRTVVSLLPAHRAAQTHSHTHTHTNTHTDTHRDTHTHTHTETHTHTHTHTPHTHTHMRAHTHKHAHTQSGKFGFPRFLYGVWKLLQTHSE